jgi:glycosyltransferase involved in cell wall biosynthesis
MHILMKELVSCIVPSYNRAHLLKEAIESTLKQTYTNWEMIIVDDRSTDNTAEMVAEYQQKDARIKYFRNPEKGVSFARNYGISMAQGDYIAFLDDDDLNMPHRFESQLNAMLQSGSRFLVSGYQERDRGSGKVINETKLELKQTCTGFPSRWMIRKDLLQLTGGFDQAASPLEDIELSARASLFEAFSLHDNIVIVGFDTENSASTATEKMLNARLVFLEKSKNILSKQEAAWWQFTVATDYYYLGNKEKAGEYLMKAARGDSRGIYRLAYSYFRFMKGLNGPFKRLNLKILSLFREFKIPVLVQHQIIANTPKKAV